jgi:hypothetical protein
MKPQMGFCPGAKGDPSKPGESGEGKTGNADRVQIPLDKSGPLCFIIFIREGSKNV